MGDGLFVGGDDLAAEAAVEVDDQRGFEVEGQIAVALADDGQDIRLVELREFERQELTSADVDRIFRGKSPRADDRQGDFGRADALQPRERRVFLIAEQNPVPAVLERDESVGEQQNVVDLDVNLAEMPSADLHGR